MSCVTVSYVVSEAGQRASLTAGGSGESVQTLKVSHDSPRFAELVALAKIDHNGDAELSLLGNGTGVECHSRWDNVANEYPTQFQKYDSEPTVDQLVDDETARRQAVAACNAEIQRLQAEKDEADLKEKLAFPAKHWVKQSYWEADGITDNAGKNHRWYRYNVEVPDDPRFEEVRQEAEALAATRTRLAKEECQAAVDKINAAIAEQNRSQQARREQIESWVKDRGTPSQKDRLAVGLLPEQDVIDAVANDMFSPLESFPRYQKVTPSDICDCSDSYGDANVEYDLEDAPSLTEEQFNKYAAIKAAMPNAKLTARLHTATCNYCDRFVKVTSLLAEVSWGEIILRRVYALD